MTHNSSKPSANQYSKEIRAAVIPDPGHKFLYLDWSAAELILTAYWAGCVELLDAYQSSDLHKYVASRILGRPDISKEERDKIKVVTFSIMYGSEGGAASRSLMIPMEEAQSYVAKFFHEFPQIADLKAKIEANAQKTGYTRTAYGRLRKIRGTSRSYGQTDASTMRQAFNTAIQGSVADMLKIAVSRTANYPNIQFLIGVFDSLLLQVPESMTEAEYLPILDELSTFKDLRLKYKYAEGYSWREVQDKT